MRQKLANLIVTVFEIGGVLCLTGIAVNAEWKRHKAEKALSEVELRCAIFDLDRCVKGIKIKHLEKELEELKAKGEA